MPEDLQTMLARRASAAVTVGDWPLLKALANVLIELETHQIVTDAAHEAWKAQARDRVVSVPLLAQMPMREERPRAGQRGGAHTEIWLADPNTEAFNAADLADDYGADDTTDLRTDPSLKEM